MIHRILLAGYGHVGRYKFTEALLKMAKTNTLRTYTKDGDIDLTIISDKEEDITEIEEMRQRDVAYHGLVITRPIKYQGSFDALDVELKDRTFSHVFIAAPNGTHAPYIKLFLKRSDFVFIEKPLVDNLDELKETESLYSLTQLERVRLVDHYLLKDVFVHFFENIEYYLKEIGDVKSIHFMLIESAAIRESRKWLYQTGMIRDLAIHALSILFKLGTHGIIQSPSTHLKLIKCEKWCYDEIPKDIENPRETAAELTYQLGEVDVKVQVGKGMGTDMKQLRISGSKATLVIDTKEKIIFIVKNDSRIETYNSPSTEFKYPEYVNLIKMFFTAPLEIGLSYLSAKRQVQHLEETDEHSEVKTYRLGTVPFSVPKQVD